jgi:hypothetical protein
MKSSTLGLSCSLAVALALSSLACSGQVALGEVDPLMQDGGGGGGGDGGGGGGAWEVPECAEPSGPQDTYSSISNVESKIAGTWFLCSGGIWSPADTAGVEFTPGEAHFLVQSGTSVTRGTTWEYARKVEFVDTTSMNGPGAYHIRLSANGFNNYVSRTSTDGRFLELAEGTSGKVARYVRATKRAAVVSGVGSCDSPLGAPHVYTSVGDVQARLAGRWKVCAGSMYAPTDMKGLEFAAPMAYFLVETPEGLVRKASWDYERRVTVIDTTAMNGAGSYQINLESTGTNTYFSRVSADGTRLELEAGTSGRKVSLARVN